VPEVATANGDTAERKEVAVSSGTKSSKRPIEPVPRFAYWRFAEAVASDGRATRLELRVAAWLLKLADTKTGTCWESNKGIAVALGYSGPNCGTHVKRALAAWERRGLIERVPLSDRRGMDAANGFRLLAGAARQDSPESAPPGGAEPGERNHPNRPPLLSTCPSTCPTTTAGGGGDDEEELTESGPSPSLPVVALVGQDVRALVVASERNAVGWTVSFAEGADGKMLSRQPMEVGREYDLTVGPPRGPDGLHPQVVDANAVPTAAEVVAAEAEAQSERLRLAEEAAVIEARLRAELEAAKVWAAGRDDVAADVAELRAMPSGQFMALGTLTRTKYADEEKAFSHLNALAHERQADPERAKGAML
jgi:hypothetical protein